MTTMLEALKAAQFVVDTTGRRVAVQLNPTLWQALLTWLEQVENMPTIEELIEISSIPESPEINVSPHQPGVSIDADRALARAAAQLSEPSLAKVWDNPEDEIYNAL